MSERTIAARFGPDPGKNFYKLHEELLWSDLPPIEKLVLIDFFHRAAKGESVPGMNERARALNVCRRTLERTEASLAAKGNLLHQQREGKPSVYLAAWPAIPAEAPNRADFEAAFRSLCTDAGCDKKSQVGAGRVRQKVAGGCDKKSQEVRQKVAGLARASLFSPSKTKTQKDRAHEPAARVTAPPSVPTGDSAQRAETPGRTTETGTSTANTPAAKAGRKTPDTPHHRLFDAYAKRLDYPGGKVPNPGKEAAAIKRLLAEGYTAPQVLACYDALKREKFWREKHLSLQTVHGQIGAWVKAHPEASHYQDPAGEVLGEPWDPNNPEHCRRYAMSRVEGWDELEPRLQNAVIESARMGLRELQARRLVAA